MTLNFPFCLGSLHYGFQNMKRSIDCTEFFLELVHHAAVSYVQFLVQLNRSKWVGKRTCLRMFFLLLHGTLWLWGSTKRASYRSTNSEMEVTWPSTAEVRKLFRLKCTSLWLQFFKTVFVACRAWRNQPSAMFGIESVSGYLLRARNFIVFLTEPL